MSIHFSNFAVHKETIYNKLSALPKHGQSEHYANTI